MKQNTLWTQLGMALMFCTLIACGGGGGGGNGGGASSRSQDNGSSAGQNSSEQSSVSSSSESNSSEGDSSSESERSSERSSASSEDGSSSSSEPATTPILANLSDQSFIQDERVSIRLTNTGGEELTECSSDLPSGLSVTISGDATTCEINGDATELVELANFTVTAVNAFGSDSAQIPLEVVAASPFVTTWKTDNEGVSNDNQILLQTSDDFSYDFRVDWGDGQVDEGVTEDITHTYDTPGEYTVSITGRFPQPFFSDPGDGTKLLTIESWGNRPWLSMNRALAHCDNAVINDTLAPNLSRVTDMSFMLFLNESFNDDISHWDVSNVEDMNHLFRGAAAFNQDISGWDVSNVTNMDSTFQGAVAFNQNIGLWDVSQVTNMTEMFREATAFNQNIGTWDVSNATTMLSMFRGTVVFNQNIGLWDVSSVTDMRAVFYDAQAFNQDIGGWDVSNVTTMSNMFRNASAFDQDLGGWDVSRVEAMEDFAPNSGLTISHYDALLNGWSALNLVEGVQLDMGSTSYSIDAESARAVLTDAFSWEISDGGLLLAPDVQSDSIALYTNNDVRFELDNLGGAVDECTSSNLPDGLTIEVSGGGTSCQLTGTPIAVQATVAVSIEATNQVGSSVSSLDIEVKEETPFITTWKTDNPGLSADNQVTIDTSGSFEYLYTVDWGDGQSDENVTGNITHTYATSGEYEVQITGAFPAIRFADTNDSSLSDAHKLLSVEHWGDRLWLSMENAFTNCDNLVINDPESPDLSSAKSLREMFSRADNFNSDIGGWEVSRITDMSGMFSGAKAFNQYIGDWDVSRVTTMSSMFFNTKAFNQDIGNWDVSSVTSMRSMFDEADAFNQDIGRWNVANVTRMNSMFERTELFNQDISEWDVSGVQNMGRMFREAKAFNQALGAWDVSSVSNMGDMFFASPFNSDISQWNVSNVTNMSRMFRGSSFNQNIGSWDVSNVSNMSDLFGAGDLSTDNYDALLIGWSQLPALKNGVELGVGSSTFSPDAQAARDTLVNDFGWIISDGGSTEAAP